MRSSSVQLVSTTVEEDAERVRAVHAALGAPLRVWAVHYDLPNAGEDFELFTDEAKARAKLVEWIEDERTRGMLGYTESEFNDLIARAASGKEHHVNNEDDKYFWIDERTVR